MVACGGWNRIYELGICRKQGNKEARSFAFYFVHDIYVWIRKGKGIMSRSGYNDCDDVLAIGRWRAQVASAIRGKRGQAFLRELAAAMDAMPEKSLIANELIDEDGNCCTIGVICKLRNIDTSNVDATDPEQVGSLVGIAKQLASEIEYENDEFWKYERIPATSAWNRVDETNEERWQRMRRWVEKNIKQ